MTKLALLALALSAPAWADPTIVQATPDETRRAVAEMEKVQRLREMNLHPELLQLPVPFTAAEAIARAAPPAR